MKWTTDEFTGRRFGKYEVLCRLAVGGMAEIFLGFPKSGPFAGAPVVIKRVLAEQREDPNAMRMLLDEAKLTATLTHPNIAAIVDLEVAEDDILLVIELIAGANLEEISEAHRHEPLPLGFTASVIREAAQGLGHAHAHRNARGEPLPIVHRDITPRNVMVDFSGNTKVLDFGIARAKGSERRTMAGMVRGTTAYMSPEQAIGRDPDTRSDLFSLGTLFHELLTGRRLFQRNNPGEEMAAVYEAEIPAPSGLNRRVPKGLDAVVLRMLERKADRRFQTAGELVKELNAATANLAWPREKCAELLKSRFAERQRDIEALVARIPRKAAPDYPESSTIITRNKPLLAPAAAMTLNDEDGSAARTLVGAQPLVSSRPELPTDPARQVAPPAVAQRASLSAAELFPDDDEPVATRIVSAGQKKAMMDAAKSSAAQTDPARNAVRSATREPEPPRPRASGTIFVAALVALLVGGVGGAFLLKWAERGPAQAVTSRPRALVKLVLETDRPADVYLDDTELGLTPVSAIVPVGALRLELQEPGGVRRALELELSGAEPEQRVTVSLDSLPALP